MTLRPYDLKDPGAVVGHVLMSYNLNAGDAGLALVHDPPGAQSVVHVRPVTAAQWGSLHDLERSDFLRSCVDEMPIDTSRRRRPEHAIVTVVARDGLAVFGAEERDWLLAWRYSNHMAPVFDAGIVLVTEHGWVDFMSNRGAGEPCLAQ